MKAESNPILDFATGYRFPEFSELTGTDKIVAFGDHSHKCPIYVRQTPPCSAECPAGEDIRAINRYLNGTDPSDDPMRSAWETAVDTNPFPAVMGRICPHPCQSKCNRGEHDESVAINAVEHAIGNYGIENGLELPGPGPDTGRHVAVIGGGPAGLSVAYQLRRKGHAVTIYDANDKLGGMVLYGIMGYRVDRRVLEAEIQRIIDLGVETRMGVRVGRDVMLEDLERDYDAVFVGVGAQVGRGLPVPGFEGTKGVTNAIDFLRSYEVMGDDMPVGRRVVVIGDGNVAMDVARLALRLGSEAAVVSGVPREEMACFDNEYDDAAREGTQMYFQTGTLEVLSADGRVSGLRCTPMVRKEKGEDGWNSPVPFLRYKASGEPFDIDADTVVAAIGQTTDMSGLESVVSGAPWLQVDRNFRVRGRENLFGGGDAIKVDLITTAVGHGRKAAEAIDAFLNDQPLPGHVHREITRVRNQDVLYFLHSPQAKRGMLEPAEVKGNHDELLQPLSQEQVSAEAERCMSCGLCFDCKQCVSFCPQEAVVRFRDNPAGEKVYTEYSQCVGCHICSLVCPSGYIQMGMGDGL
ncbi:NAD(P)-binding protein [Prosthecochloris sp. N3]|uniref:NAD(P)-binding protein n=1 Tax=Prosthecochloris ethylica TaxID=2743976 RepID=A0ABR9XRJ1_9CHLB|nr:NAD(P)-binding protein [Prosthecochloris ethylica]MBF0585996.1 NAD(P)-binding protein [Prosthecochloris ethylica]MBF0636604.1 NAD(P)-binding protein [Prosthecochloris ethylica]MEC9487199.1 NAD(P)-binding protein [Prosthecochloris sp.]NUK47236.1 NAD(P)-binding protein [Prosthecochloris ethylica]